MPHMAQSSVVSNLDVSSVDYKHLMMDFRVMYGMAPANSLIRSPIYT